MKKVAVGIISRIRVDGDEEFLLVKSARDFGEYTKCYYPPGGHIEQDETIQECLRREILEETGLNIHPIQELAITLGDIPDQETHWWKCEITGGIFSIQEDEITDAIWKTAKELQSVHLWPATKKFFNEVLFSTQNKF